MIQQREASGTEAAILGQVPHFETLRRPISARLAIDGESFDFRHGNYCLLTVRRDGHTQTICRPSAQLDCLHKGLPVITTEVYERAIDTSLGVPTTLERGVRRRSIPFLSFAANGTPGPTRQAIPQKGKRVRSLLNALVVGR